MEMLREVAPVLVGLMLSPALMLLMQPAWRLMAKVVAFLGPVIAVGATISLMAGELTGTPFPEPLFAVALDSLLVGVGAVVAYRFVWKRVLETRLEQRRLAPVPEEKR